MTGSVIVAALRSAVVPRGGAFSHLALHELGAPVVTACLEACGLEADQVDEVIAGNALGAGGNPARHIALAAGLPERVAGLTLDRQCCGGMDALLIADALIRSGQAQVVVAGGVESYSRRPLRSETFADGSEPRPYDQARFTPWPMKDPDMSDAANDLASELCISREDQDAWAVNSHQKAIAAKSRLINEIAPIEGVRHDPFTRNLSEGLCTRAKVISGSITAANTSVAADAAAFCVVVSDEVARSLNVPSAQIAGGATLGGRADMPGLAPIEAIQAVLARASVSSEQLNVVEVMEAYAAQAIACVDGAGLASTHVNLGGGSLARGHPIGASGAINVVRLFHELSERKGFGLGAIAAAGGLGTAILLQV